MRILITGGLGFIGSVLVRKLMDTTNYEILNIDNCTYAAMPESLQGRENESRYEFQKIDITNYEAIKKSITGFKPNKIFHLAAESHVDRSIDNPSAFINTNILGTYNILQSLKLSRDMLPKNFIFIHISTDEVFGTLSFEDKPFNEQSPYQPNSPYSASKASSDLLVRAWNETYKLKVAITNCSNNYGPWQNPEKLIPKIIFNALENNPIPIYGNGQNIRDWLHVNDHVDALLAAAESPALFSRYTIGANQEISNIHLTKMICEYLDKKVPKEESYFKQVIFIEDRLGHDLRYAIDSSYISKTLGFNAEYDLKSGIEETIDWYLDNQDWVKDKIKL
ncbi:MAG TPA: dTDP-glucose 4,6-dehydratase [Methylophilaceae bacterium]|nr:dTDP-glucose 4,6-dehydratase [Methylophilaceae bacterium]